MEWCDWTRESALPRPPSMPILHNQSENKYRVQIGSRRLESETKRVQRTGYLSWRNSVTVRTLSYNQKPLKTQCHGQLVCIVLCDFCNNRMLDVYTRWSLEVGNILCHAATSPEKSKKRIEITPKREWRYIKRKENDSVRAKRTNHLNFDRLNKGVPVQWMMKSVQV